MANDVNGAIVGRRTASEGPTRVVLCVDLVNVSNTACLERNISDGE